MTDTDGRACIWLICLGLVASCDGSAITSAAPPRATDRTSEATPKSLEASASRSSGAYICGKSGTLVVYDFAADGARELIGAEFQGHEVLDMANDEGVLILKSRIGDLFVAHQRSATYDIQRIKNPGGDVTMAALSSGGKLAALVVRPLESNSVAIIDTSTMAREATFPLNEAVVQALDWALEGNELILEAEISGDSQCVHEDPLTGKAMATCLLSMDPRSGKLTRLSGWWAYRSGASASFGEKFVLPTSSVSTRGRAFGLQACPEWSAFHENRPRGDRVGIVRNTMDPAKRERRVLFERKYSESPV